MRLICRVWVCGALLVVCGASAWGQGEPAAYKPPEDIDFRKATIISEGTRMAAELFSSSRLDGKKLPTIIMCHGWGGTADRLRPDGACLCAGRIPGGRDRLPRLGRERSSCSWLRSRCSRTRKRADSPPKSWRCAKSSIRWIRAPICTTRFTGCMASRNATRNHSDYGDRVTPAAMSSMPPPATSASGPWSARFPAWILVLSCKHRRTGRRP